jgi:hypothetical protein
VIERLRVLLDRPLEPSVARAVLLLTLAVGIGLAIVVALSGVGRTPTTIESGGSRSSAIEVHARGRPEHGSSSAVVLAQDPQDRPGSTARRRATGELAAHRALQHVPFEGDGVSIDLVGARGGRAALRVQAATRAEARDGWHVFLRRFHDRGDAYIPSFEGDGR